MPTPGRRGSGGRTSSGCTPRWAVAGGGSASARAACARGACGRPRRGDTAQRPNGRSPTSLAPHRGGHDAVLLDAGRELVGRVGRVVEREQVAVLVVVREGTERERLIGRIVVRALPLEAARGGRGERRVAQEGRIQVTVLVV